MLFEAQRYTLLRKEKVKENVQFLFVFFLVPAAVAPSTFCRFSKVVREGPTTEPSRSLMCLTRNEIFCDHMEAISDSGVFGMILGMTFFVLGFWFFLTINEFGSSG